MKPTKSNSSFGNWAVRVSNTEIKFFEGKKEAQQFIDNNMEYLEDFEKAMNDPVHKEATK